MDLPQNVPFDAQALIDVITDGTTINEAEGWVQNLPQRKTSSANFSKEKWRLEFG
ncbi:MAG: hypothetical protein L3K25_17995 [Gammaproteobacteria bacterium]|nr:hypothetical protein [Gammaproteobacteria bacterium]